MAVSRVPVEFATALRTARLIRGLSRPEVAEAAGVSTTEASAIVPGPAEFARLWSALTSDPPSSEGSRP